MIKKIIPIGTKFGMLTVTGVGESTPDSKSTSIVICKCGNKKTVRNTHLKSKGTKSCGCGQNKFIHSMSNTPEYKIWAGIKQRCTNSKNKDFNKYGGRGIKVCKRWLNSFENFYEDMGNRPKGGTIDRVNNNKGYLFSNCRWATYKEQTRNRRNTIRIDYNGRVLSLAEWADKYKLIYGTLLARYHRGIQGQELFKKVKKICD